MSKKYYAVKKGRACGIFNSWAECEKQVKGFPGAEFKSFTNLQEADGYLQNGASKSTSSNSQIEQKIANIDSDSIIAFVDGSFFQNVYSYGAVIISNDAVVEKSDSFTDDKNIESRNVAGEIMGAKCAISYAISQKKKNISIYYDYQGIERWANKSWKANLPLTKEYVSFIDEARKHINIDFTHVKAHSGIVYNERADSLAKEAINSKTK